MKRKRAELVKELVHNSTSEHVTKKSRGRPIVHGALLELDKITKKSVGEKMKNRVSEGVGGSIGMDVQIDAAKPSW